MVGLGQNPCKLLCACIGLLDFPCHCNYQVATGCVLLTWGNASVQSGCSEIAKVTATLPILGHFRFCITYSKRESLHITCRLKQKHPLHQHTHKYKKTQLDRWVASAPRCNHTVLYCTMDNHIGTDIKRRHIYNLTLVLHTCSMQCV